MRTRFSVFRRVSENTIVSASVARQIPRPKAKGMVIAFLIGMSLAVLIPLLIAHATGY